MHALGWWNSISMKEGVKGTTADLVDGTHMLGPV